MPRNIVQCRQCGTWLDLTSFAVGQTVACPCGTRLTVPWTPEPGAPPGGPQPYGDQSWQKRTSAGFQPPPPAPPMAPGMLPGLPPGVHVRPPRLPTYTRAGPLSALGIVACLLFPCICLIIGLIKGEETGRAMVKYSIISLIVQLVLGGLSRGACQVAQ